MYLDFYIYLKWYILSNDKEIVVISKTDINEENEYQIQTRGNRGEQKLGKGDDPKNFGLFVSVYRVIRLNIICRCSVVIFPYSPTCMPISHFAVSKIPKT